jgi:uncharacterized integral membrane protein (TIGR00698 family)
MKSRRLIPTPISAWLSVDLGVVFGLAAMAWGLGWLLNESDLFSPGASAIAMFAGMGVALATGWDFGGGRVVVKRVLPVAIVLLGFQLDLSVISGAEIGVTGLVAIAATVSMSFLVSIVAARFLRVPGSSGAALGAGGAICGNSAVLAVAPSLRLKHEDMALVLAAINLLGLVMFFVVVAASDALGLDPIAAGIWAGSAIHAVPQAIAAGEAIGPEGLAVATAVKLSRVSLLIIVVPLFGILGRRFNPDPELDANISWKSALRLPMFVPGFVLAVIVGNLMPDQAAETLGYSGRVILLPVLAAVGLAITRTTLKQTGGRVFVVGALATVALASASLLAVVALYD